MTSGSGSATLPPRARVALCVLVIAASIAGAAALGGSLRRDDGALALIAAAAVMLLVTRALRRFHLSSRHGASPSLIGTFLVALAIVGDRPWIVAGAVVLHGVQRAVIDARRSPSCRALGNCAVTMLAGLGATLALSPPLAAVVFIVLNNAMVGTLTAATVGREAVHRMLDVRLQAVGVFASALGVPLGMYAPRAWWVAFAAIPALCFVQVVIVWLQCAAPDRSAVGAMRDYAWTATVELVLPTLSAGAVVMIRCEQSAQILALIRSSIRPGDLVSETPGGFVTFHPWVGNLTRGAEGVAKRLREVLGPLASGVGYASKPEDDMTLDGLMAAAAADAVIDEAVRQHMA